MEKNRPPVIFYSNVCNHSKSLLSEYRDPSEKAGVKFVCIDGQLDKIPPFISKVPALLIPQEKSVLFNHDLRVKLNSIISLTNLSTQIHAVEAQTNGSEVFSFIKGPQSDLEACENRVDHIYADPFSVATNFTSLSEPQDTGPDVKLSSSSLDSFAAKRDRDLSEIMSSQPDPRGSVL